MTAKEFLKGVKLKTETSGIKTDLEPTEGMEELLEDYHQAKLKLLGIANVSKSVTCEHDNETLHQGDGFVYKTCTDCGEDI